MSLDDEPDRLACLYRTDDPDRLACLYQTDDPDRRTNATEKRVGLKCGSQYCIFLTALFIGMCVIIIPFMYFMYVRGQQKTHNDPITYEGKTTRVPLPWYMHKGTIWPSDFGGERIKIWPEEDTSDRIEYQLMFKPYENKTVVKTVVVYNDVPRLRLSPGHDYFFKCPVTACSISTNISEIDTAAAVLFSDEQLVLPTFKNGRPPNQVWILFLSQIPRYTKDLEHFSGSINWTSSYRSDSDVVVPYNKWVYHNKSVKLLPKAHSNFAEGKHKKVVWFVRDYRQGDRMRREYVEELSKYIKVDIFGDTDDHQCPCACQSPDECFKLLHQYKFFLAFEKFSCQDYITGGVFISLQRGVVPIVKGAGLYDYLKFIPHHSYIHADSFSSPKQLAEYLHRLDQNDDLYNEYFRWRCTGEWIDTMVGCRICALLHTNASKSYGDVNSWWG